MRLEVPFGVGYGSNPHQVKKLVEKAVSGIPKILASPTLIVHFSQFGDSSLDFEVRFWICDPIEGLANIKSQILFRIWDALTENDIETPFPEARSVRAVRDIREAGATRTGEIRSTQESRAVATIWLMQLA